MGYGHTFAFTPNDPRFRALRPQLLLDCAAILQHVERVALVDLAGGTGFGRPRAEGAVIDLNGSRAEGEDYDALTLDLDLPPGPGGFTYGFCRTGPLRPLPYDLAVTCVLLRAHQLAPEHVALNSDGDWDTDWAPARAVHAALFHPVATLPPFTGRLRAAGPIAARSAPDHPAPEQSPHPPSTPKDTTMTTTATLTGATLQLDLQNAPEVEHRPGVMLTPHQTEITYAPDPNGTLGVTVTVNGRTRRKDGLLATNARWVRYQPGHRRPGWVQKLVVDNVPPVLRAALGAGPDGQRHQAARRTAFQDAEECTCVVSCADDPATACSHSGVLHVHPAGPAGTFGPCPVHPDAPGDL